MHPLRLHTNRQIDSLSLGLTEGHRMGLICLYEYPWYEYCRKTDSVSRPRRSGVPCLGATKGNTEHCVAKRKGSYILARPIPRRQNLLNFVPRTSQMSPINWALNAKLLNLIPFSALSFSTLVISILHNIDKDHFSPFPPIANYCIAYNKTQLREYITHTAAADPLVRWLA